MIGCKGFTLLLQDLNMNNLYCPPYVACDSHSENFNVKSNNIPLLIFCLLLVTFQFGYSKEKFQVGRSNKLGKLGQDMGMKKTMLPTSCLITPIPLSAISLLTLTLYTLTSVCIFFILSLYISQGSQRRICLTIKGLFSC